MEVSALARRYRTPWDPLWAVAAGRTASGAVFRVFLLLLVLGSALIVTTVLAAIGRARSRFGIVGKAGICGAVGADQCGRCVWSLSGSLRPGEPSPTVRWLPGALAAAIIWQLLQWFGAIYVSQVVNVVERHQ